MLENELRDVIETTPCIDEQVRHVFVSRLPQGAFTRDENPTTHFCEYFLPYNPKTKEVFFVHHKKSGFWLSPGGHIDKGERLLQTLNREIEEELGVHRFFADVQKPFFLSYVDIKDGKRTCRRHYDLWYLVLTDGSGFHVDDKEFHDYRWMSIADAIAMTKDAANKEALGYLQKTFK